MNFKTIITLIAAGLVTLGLTSSLVHARPFRHHHSRPRVSFGFNVGAPVIYAQPYLVAPCHYACAPIAPVIYRAPLIRPSFGVSFGAGPVGFGFSV